MKMALSNRYLGMGCLFQIDPQVPTDQEFTTAEPVCIPHAYAISLLLGFEEGAFSPERGGWDVEPPHSGVRII